VALTLCGIVTSAVAGNATGSIYSNLVSQYALSADSPVQADLEVFLGTDAIVQFVFEADVHPKGGMWVDRSRYFFCHRHSCKHTVLTNS
jgi:hypothetical protein